MESKPSPTLAEEQTAKRRARAAEIRREAEAKRSRTDQKKDRPLVTLTQKVESAMTQHFSMFYIM